MPRISTKQSNLKAFEDAREAVIKLETLSRILAPADLETLEILLDKHATYLISKSLQEAERGKYKSIETILS
jgi:hypothetical protein